MEKATVKPRGELVLQNVAMPADANAYGDMFGGWLVSQMDLGGAVLAHQKAKNRITTIAIDKLVFLKPVFIGDLVGCYAEVVKTGRSSITIKIEVWAKRMRLWDFEQVGEGVFTYVAIDEKRQSKTIDWALE